MGNFSIIQKQNYLVTGQWRDIGKYQMRKYLVLDNKSCCVVSDFSNFRQAQKLARHLNKMEGE